MLHRSLGGLTLLLLSDCTTASGEVDWSAVQGITGSIGLLVVGLALVVSAWQAWLMRQELAQNRDNILITQSSLIFPLWDNLYQDNEEFRDINPDDPVSAHVISNANRMALMAICWQSKAIHHEVLFMLIAQDYLKVYGQIESCANIPGIGPGKAFLENEFDGLLAIAYGQISDHKRDKMAQRASKIPRPGG